MAKPGTKAWKQQYREVIVGWHRASNSPRMIYVRNDGGMSGDNQIHHPVGGRRAEDEAVIVFHLSEIRSFAIHDQEGPRKYVQELRDRHDGETADG